MFIVMLQTLSVLGEQMEWGDNPDLVEESDPIQGREHIKLMVLLVGESIDLECQVAFTSKPVSEIRWKIDGKRENKKDDPIVETKNGEVFVENHLKIGNITEDMDSSTVSCEYSKGQYGASVEAVLRIFKLEIETSQYVCKPCKEIVKLTFKESKRSSPAEETVDKLIKAKISEITKSDKISVDSSGYSVSLPIGTVKDNNFIMNMKPIRLENGFPVMETLDKCCQSVWKEPANNWVWDWDTFQKMLFPKIRIGRTPFIYN